MLLARYFQTHGNNMLSQVDFQAMKETRFEPLWSAWSQLADAQRQPMETDFCTIYALSCPKGWQAILDEAAWHCGDAIDQYEAFVEQLAALPNHYHRAMVTFLDYTTYWRGATCFYHADTLRTTGWRKRKNLGQRSAAVDENSINQLADWLSNYFHYQQGRGRHCKVEPLRRGERDYFFAYPEDYAQASLEWIDGQFEHQPHHPAFEVVFVYAQQEGSLDIHCEGTTKTVDALQHIFAQAILKLDTLPDDLKDKRVYELDILKQPFCFTFDPSSGIEYVRVKKLRLSSQVNGGDCVTVEANARGDEQAIYTLLDGLTPALNINHYRVTQVELVTSTIIDPEKPQTLDTIRITYPNSCSLKYDQHDLLLRDMLAQSGIEPREMTESASVKDNHA